MDQTLTILVAAFFFIALIYSSVGFGGGSSYLALLAVMSVPVDVLRPTALLCNIVVVTGGAYIFWRSGALDFRRALPFIAISIPMAFLGGRWRIADDSVFFVLLGSCLLIAALLLWSQPPRPRGTRLDSPVYSGLLGGGIGFLSGLIGIGGGIFLAPVLNLLNWGDARKVSALASLFILVNSVSGLAGQITGSSRFEWRFILPLLLAVLAGGQIGARVGARKFDPAYIRKVTAVLIFVAAVKILRDQL